MLSYLFGQPSCGCGAAPNTNMHDLQLDDEDPLLAYPLATADFGHPRSKSGASRQHHSGVVDHGRADTSTTEIQYVGQAALEAVTEKLQIGMEINNADVERLASPDFLSDDDFVVPIQCGFDTSNLARLIETNGPRAMAAAFVKARMRCESAAVGDAMTVRQWRSMVLEADGSLKPLLLTYVVLTALGSGILTMTAQDASRSFCLAALIHLNAEVVLWTYLLFGIGPDNADTRWPLRLLVRVVCFAGNIVMATAPLRPDGLAGPLAISTFVGMTAVSDTLCFWLGLFYFYYRLDICVRRIGLALLVHGLSSGIMVAGWINPLLFTDDGTTGLHNLATVLHTTATFLALVSVVHIFSAEFHLRAQQPSARSVGVMWGCTAAMLATMPPAIGLTWADLYRLVWTLDAKPIAFLPRGSLLYAHKVIASLGALVLVIYAMNEFNLAKQRPLAPMFSTFVGSSVWRRFRWASEQTAAEPSAFGGTEAEPQARNSRRTMTPPISPRSMKAVPWGSTETEPQTRNSRRTMTPPISPRSLKAVPSRWPTPPRAVMAHETRWNTPSQEMNEMRAGGMHPGLDVLS